MMVIWIRLLGFIRQSHSNSDEEMMWITGFKVHNVQNFYQKQQANILHAETRRCFISAILYYTDKTLFLSIIIIIKSGLNDILLVSCDIISLFHRFKKQGKQDGEYQQRRLRRMCFLKQRKKHQ